MSSKRVLAIILASFTGSVTAAPNFVAVCKQTGSQRFDHGVTSDGKPLSNTPEWGDDPVSSPYVFRYEAKAKAVTLDSQFRYTVLAETNDSIMFGATYSDDAAINSYVYSLNLSFKTMVFTQNQLTHLIGRSVMGRIYSFNCQITTF
jgi:hypothetical protein